MKSKAIIYEWVLTDETIGYITEWAAKGNRWRKSKFYSWEYEAEYAGCIERAINNRLQREDIKLTKAGITIAKLNQDLKNAKGTD